MGLPSGRRRRAVLALALMVAAAAGCGGGTAASDPDLETAAQTVQEELRGSFENTFAGMQIDSDNDRLIVYRVPDPRLDARVREVAPSVPVDLRDAAHSLAAMRRTVDRVMADTAYWAERGIGITGAAPEPDGSGVTVYTRSGDDADLPALAERYPEMPLTVEKRTIVPATEQPESPIVISPPPLPEG